MAPHDEGSSSCIAHEPCPSCGSRDNLARYSDGHGYCFGCQHYEPGEGEEREPRKAPRMSADLLTDGEFRALEKRGITIETCRKFGYQTGTYKGRPVQIAPYKPLGSTVAQKIRFPDKDFTVLGNAKDMGLFGQHLWAEGGRRIVITEGEIDALTVSQLQGNKWPVVSLPNGAGGARKALDKQLKYLLTFEEVVLMFDMDDPGREAVADCVGLFPPGKVKVATLPRKDPNEMLLADEGDQVISAIWQAQAWRPDGVVTLSELRQRVLTPPVMGLPWFMPSLTELTYGRRYGEVYAFGAGTGIGKTDWLTQQMQFDLTVLNEPIGIFALEQQPEETAKRLTGKIGGKRFHVPDGSWTTAELEAALEALEAGGKVFFYDSFGATEWDRIELTIRHLHHAEGVRIFYLDHLTALAAEEEDERKALERIMAKIGKIVKELGIILHLVSHLATPEGKPHEEGGRVMIRHFKGSRSIGFWCHYIFALERSSQDEDEKVRSTTTFRVLKDRYTGQATGKTFFLGYDATNGQLYETCDPHEGFRDETATSPDGGRPDF
jgi:twinkle protein